MCIPLGPTRPNAEHVETVGAESRCRPTRPSAQISEAIELALAEPSYAASARRFAAEYDPTARRAIDSESPLDRLNSSGCPDSTRALPPDIDALASQPPSQIKR